MEPIKLFLFNNISDILFIIKEIIIMSKPKDKSLLGELGGIFKYKYSPLQIDEPTRSLVLPERFTNFPLIILITLFISNGLKLLVPFAIEYLYVNMNPHNILQPLGLFLITIMLNYYFELRSEKVMSLQQLKIRQILCQRAIKTEMRKPYQQLTKQNQSKEDNPIKCWSKISTNINIFVDNYYSSLVSLIFETMKAIVIITYLFTKLGIVTIVGLVLGISISIFIKFISKQIQIKTFINNKIIQNKASILTEYFSRIVDYQMSWLDGFVGDRVQHLENQYQDNLRTIKLLDAWCVGLWQFTQIGISSVVLCLYYFNSGQNKQGFTIQNLQPATIIYLFQMLTMPLNSISWNILGLQKAKRAISQLNESERDPKVQIEKDKQIQNFKFEKEIEKVAQILQGNKIFVINSDDTLFMKKLALYFSYKGEKVAYAEQNGFLLPNFLQNIYLKSSSQLQSTQIQNDIQKILGILKMVKGLQLPIQNLVSTYSGGQKMRLSLARAFFNGKYIVINSDLTSLDEKTRKQVFSNIRKNLQVDKQYTVVIKGKKQDDEIQEYIDSLITITGKQNIQISLKDFTIKKNEQKQKKEELQQYEIIKQKLITEINNLSNVDGSENLNEHGQSKQQGKKLKLSLKTLKFYFHFKMWHIGFVLSLAAMYAVGNYYNYFVNVNKPSNPTDYAWVILYITILYIGFIILRSIIFAIGNLKEAKRISSLTDRLIIYNHIEFYDRPNIVEDEAEDQQVKKKITQEEENNKNLEPNKQKNMSTQKLVCLCTSDSKTVNDIFPWTTNILWNNIAAVIGSLVMVFLQVPSMIIFTFLFILSVRELQANYRKNNQSLVVQSKDQEVRLMNSVNNIEQGVFYLHVYGMKEQFLTIFNRQLQNISNRASKQLGLSLWVKTNFRANMILFLIFSVGLFILSSINERNGQQQKQASKMAVMVRYILLLADYIFYLTMSIAQCRGQAISIERIRKFVQNSTVVKRSFDRLKRSKEKRQQMIQQLKQQKAKKDISFVKLANFCYSYDKKSLPVFKNLNLQIKAENRLVLKGKTGSGKTTLFKILMGLYPQIYFPTDTIHLMSFSSQHPLKLGDCSILQKLDPYKILQHVPTAIRNKVMQKISGIIQKSSKNSQISYEQQVLINNLRAYLYGFAGLAIYDEPQCILDEQNGTYIVVTHHGKFTSTTEYKLQNGSLHQIQGNMN